MSPTFYVSFFIFSFSILPRTSSPPPFLFSFYFLSKFFSISRPILDEREDEGIFFETFNSVQSSRHLVQSLKRSREECVRLTFETNTKKISEEYNDPLVCTCTILFQLLPPPFYSALVSLCHSVFPCNPRAKKPCNRFSSPAPVANHIRENIDSTIVNARGVLSYHFCYERTNFRVI